MAVDKANVRADLVSVSVAGNEYHLAEVSLTLGGEKIPISPANIGEVIGYLHGARNFEIEIVWCETAPAVVRALLGFDASGTDAAPAVGAACAEVEIKVWDPSDGAKLAQIIAPACVLMSSSIERAGESGKPAELTTVYMAVRHSGGDVWRIGSGT
ncbi:MAG: hypothetical protein ACKVZJ_10295 [Phycisphaerales bacterium]